MKVLYTVINGEIAGGQMVCLQIVEALLRSGYQALVVSPSEGPFTELLREKRIPVFLIPFKKTYSFHRAFQLAKLVQKEKVDLIHSHGTVPVNVHSRLAARLASIPCISHIHAANVFNAHPLIRRYQVVLDNWTSHFCDRLIAVSKATKESLVQQGIRFPILRQILGDIYHKRGRTEEAFLEYRDSVNFVRPVLIPYSCSHCGNQQDEWIPCCKICGKLETLTIQLPATDKAASSSRIAAVIHHD